MNLTTCSSTRTPRDKIDSLIAVLDVFNHAVQSHKIQSTKARDDWLRFLLYFEVHTCILKHELQQYLKCCHRSPAEDLIDRVVALLADSILDDGYQHLQQCRTRPILKLDSFLSKWSSLSSAEEKEKLLLASIPFDTRERRIDLLSSIQIFSDQFKLINTQFPESQCQFQPTAAVSAVTAELNFQVGDTVSLLHEAFCRRLSCSCLDIHSVWARIALSTYQGSSPETSAFEYDIMLGLLASKDEWKEALVRIKDLEPSSATAAGASDSSLDPHSIKAVLHQGQTRQSIEELCHPIRSSLLNPYARLSLELEGEQLFKLKSSRSPRFKSDELFQPITLSQVIQGQEPGFGEKVKRILAVILGYSVFHLHGSPWLATSWHSNDIVFLNAESNTPLRPYLCRKLTAEYCGGETTSLDIGHSNVDPDDFPLHPYPELVSLGILLMEIYFTRTIEDLAKRCEVELTNETNARFFAVLEIFKRTGSSMSDRYRAAVDACLDPNIATDFANEQQDDSRAKSIRTTIFHKIVSPLEQELETGFGSCFSVKAIDEVAMDIDISQKNRKKRKWPFEEPATKLETTLAQMLAQEGDSAIGKEKEFHSRSVKPAERNSESHCTELQKSSDCNIDLCNLENNRHLQVAVICALKTEADAIHAVMDSFWDESSINVSLAAADDNTYTYGTIGRHDIILAYMPGMGNINASSVATNLRNSFPNISLALIVGVCGGVPSPNDREEIHLGDLIISTSVIKYDFGRGYHNGFVPKDTIDNQLRQPSRRIRNNLAKWNTRRYKQQIQRDITAILKQLQVQIPEMCHPGAETDQLYDSTYVHRHHEPHADCWSDYCDSDTSNTCRVAIQASCERLACDPARIVRCNPKKCHPAIHFGAIGSSDTVMKSGVHRDELAKKFGLIGFEMEGAGVWEQFPCIVIKGVSDYADSHKSKDWQSYASAVAAAGMKALLKM